MTDRFIRTAVALLALGAPGAMQAQTPVPTTQPSYLTIFREEVKYGHAADHEMLEAGWPAAYAKAKAPGTYIAITSLSGPTEAWFIQPFTSWKAYGDGMKFEGGNVELSAELARLSKADAEHVSAGRSVHLMARPELSAGTFPSIATIRFYEITWFRVRPGHEPEFERIAAAYKAAFVKAAPQASYRVYQVVAGMTGPTFAIFASFQDLAELDKAAAMEPAIMGAISADDLRAMQQFSADGMINAETQRFAMNGPMSYVDQATIDQDPAFWRPKRPAQK